jgi:hypothetical protein
MRIAWLDGGSGISGDMTLGALVAAGWPAAEVEGLPRRLGLDSVRVEVSPVRRGALAATRVEVRVEEAKQPHRHLRHVEAILDGADLPAPTRERAKAVFRRLAEAEAAVHGSTVEQVHFHEVGAADALVDVAGAVEGLRALGVERVFAAPPVLGRGTVDTQHGRIPVPAPATALLLRGAPVELGDVETELTTPTGAALLATLVEDWSAPPPFTIRAVGVGAGARDPKERANVLRLTLGDTRQAGVDLAAPAGLVRREVAVLETAVDDENPQLLAAAAAALLDAGALDALLVPAHMKKGRPGTLLVVVAEPASAGALAAKLLAETSSLGVRVRHDARFELPRRTEEVETPFGRVAVKVAVLPDGSERAVAEFESVRAASARAGRALREVSEAAVAAWRARVHGGH